MKKHSLKRQMVLMFVIVMTGTLLIAWVINNVFLEDYYIINKQVSLAKSYRQLDEVITGGLSGDSPEARYLNRQCQAGNIILLVIGSSGSTVAQNCSEPDAELLKSRLYTYLIDPEASLDPKEPYEIREVSDQDTATDYLEMWGMLSNGNFFIFRSPVSSIRESVFLANRFMAYIAMLVVVVSGVLFWFISKRITDPVLELAGISERMSKLDFEAKYTRQCKNEMDILGNHMNQMSETLEKTISELKTVNNELEKDIQEKIQIDEMRKEFLSNVSHELKTPIALIQGYAEGLKECINDDDESRDFYCEVIMDEAGKMNKMVKNLLSLNQLEFGNDTVTMERFDITALIRNILQSTDILIQQNEIHVIFQQEEPVQVWADEFKVEEVFTNYLSNAIHHADNEKIIEIRILRMDKNIRVSVFNTGTPIPEEDIDRVWTKFYKVDKARTREYGGSGIGLSIVKAIMDSFHKECGVQNYENGVEFWFELDSSVGEMAED